jgi:hypothetical protein
LKGIVDPSLHGGRFVDDKVNFYRYQIKSSVKFSVKANKAFMDLLDCCIFACQVERQQKIKFEQTLRDQGKTTISRLQILYQSKFGLILAIYIYNSLMVLYLIYIYSSMVEEPEHR